MKRTAESTITFSLEQFNRQSPALDKRNLLAQILLCAVFAMSIAAGVLETIQIAVPYVGIAVAALITAAGLQALAYLNEKKRVMGNVICLVIPLFGAGLLWKWTSNGIAIISNQVLRILGAAQGHIYMPFVVDAKLDEPFSIMVISIFAAIWLTVLAAYLQRENHPFISISIAVLLTILNGCLPQWESGLWLLVTGLCTGLHLAKGQLGKEKHLWRMIAAVLCVAVAVWMICLIGAGTLETWKGDLTASARERIVEWSDEKRYGDDGDRAMPMGDFEALESLVFSDKAMLKIKTDTTWESLYLRGFVGGTFDGEKWQQIEGEKLYQSADAFYWLHEEGYFGQNALAKSAQILDQKGTTERKNFAVEMLGADRSVLYTPYEMTALTAEGENILQNTVLSEDSFWSDGWSGTVSYEMETLTNQVKKYPSLIAALIDRLDTKELKSFRNAESHYNRFVYQNYTTLSKEEKKLLKKHLGETGYKEGSHLEYEKAKDKISTYLETYVLYSEVLLERTKGTHFVEDFLETSRAGYSVHYATTAALMFRYYGIPARYVEGYLITPDAVKAAKGSEEMIITDEAAHAWVEYYQDGIGWIPFEVTPPYLDVMEKPETTSTAGAGDSSDQNNGAGLGMEMIEDNYESEEPEKEEPEKVIPWGKILGGIGILLLICILALLIRHFYLRRRRIKALQHAFDQENYAAAIAALFAYILALQEALDITRRNGSIYDYADEVGVKFGQDMKDDYLRTARIYQKAVYSQQQMTEEERNHVKTYKDALRNEIRKNCSLSRRAKLRWIKGLY